MRSLVSPMPDNRAPLRILTLFTGLVAYGVSDGLLVQAGLGLDPWDVFQQGLSRTFGLQIGTWAIIVGALVLVLWWPLHQRPGWGTLANVIMVGLMINVTVAVVPLPHARWLQLLDMVGAVILNGIATGAYIGAGMGAGPRDGLTVGIAARGHSIRLVRSLIELSVLIIGWLLGGSIGIGTVTYALAIGPLTHVFIPFLTLRDRARTSDCRSNI